MSLTYNQSLCPFDMCTFAFATPCTCPRPTACGHDITKRNAYNIRGATITIRRRAHGRTLFHSVEYHRRRHSCTACGRAILALIRPGNMTMGVAIITHTKNPFNERNTSNIALFLSSSLLTLLNMIY